MPESLHQASPEIETMGSEKQKLERESAKELTPESAINEINDVMKESEGINCSITFDKSRDNGNRLGSVRLLVMQHPHNSNSCHDPRIYLGLLKRLAWELIQRGYQLGQHTGDFVAIYGKTDRAYDTEATKNDAQGDQWYIEEKVEDVSSDELKAKLFLNPNVEKQKTEIFFTQASDKILLYWWWQHGQKRQEQYYPDYPRELLWTEIEKRGLAEKARRDENKGGSELSGEFT